jgi:hypothetical protein
MTLKSVLGYVLAFALAIIIWQVITRLLDKRFIENPITTNEKRIWTILQWGSTGFLWGQWLIQDFANIYVYLPRAIGGFELTVSLVILLTMLAYIFYSRGGAIQEIVKAKTNTVDIRSATIIDFLYALILLFFKQYSNVPMSTTWVFLGLLAGREIAIRYQLGKGEASSGLVKLLGQAMNVVLLGVIAYVVYLRDAVGEMLIYAFAGVIIARAAIVFFETRDYEPDLKGTFRMVGSDLAKVTFGLIISIVLVYVMKFLTGI